MCFPVDAWPILEMAGVLTLPMIEKIKAEQNGSLVGFVAGDIKRYEGTGWISTICVHPEYRGLGIATVLLELCEESMRMPKVKLSVRESNFAAIGLYNKAGYNHVGKWPKYYKGGEDAVIMEKLI